MKQVLRLHLLAACCVLFAACSTPKQQQAHEVLTPMPEYSFADPTDAQFMAAVKDYINARQGPAFTRYEFTRIDLDGDGRRDGIVMMNTPHSYWCGFNGCSMVVFRARNETFELVSEISPVRGPLLVSDSRSNGWRDLIIRVDGRMELETKDVALRFDGKTYPSQPAFQPALYASNDRQGTKIFP